MPRLEPLVTIWKLNDLTTRLSTHSELDYFQHVLGPCVFPQNAFFSTAVDRIDSVLLSYYAASPNNVCYKKLIAAMNCPGENGLNSILRADPLNCQEAAQTV
jgi:hypothetical protein